MSLSGPLIGFLVLVPTLSSAFSTPDSDVPAMNCAKRVEELFPMITIETQELDLERAKLRQVEHAVIIPLKSPHGDVRAVRWVANDAGMALDFIRLLRQGKIGAVNVTPFVHTHSEIYIARGASPEALTKCQKEHIADVLGQCSECDVTEWLKLTP